MSVENLATKAVYSTNGVVKEFDIPFQFTNLNQIAVYLTDMILGETVKINSNIEINEYTKKVTYPLVDLPLESGWQITIIRETVPSQESNLTQSGWFQPKVLMDMCDKLTLITQEHAEKIARSIRYSVNETPTEPETKGFLSIVEAARDQAIIARDEAREIYNLAIIAKDEAIGAIENQKTLALDEIESGKDQGILELNLKKTEVLNDLEDILLNIQTIETSINEIDDHLAIVSDEIDSKHDNVQTRYGQVLDMFNSVTTMRAGIIMIANDVNDTLLSVLSIKDEVIVKKNEVSNLKDQVVIDANSAAIAASSALSSLSAINEAITKIVWHDVVFLTNADSPFEISQIHNGKLFSIDCSAGDVLINLPEVGDLDLETPWTMGVKKTDASGNSIVITPGGTDLIDSKASKEINSQDAGATLIPDIDPNPDQWTSCDFGISGGGIGQAQGSRSNPLLISDNTQVTLLPQKSTQTIFVASSGGAVSSTHAAPFKTDNMVIGQKISLIGCSDVDTIKYTETVSLILNGDAELGLNNQLTLEFIGSDGTNESYLEIGRNF